jgi:general secretion pathway protein L
MVADSLGLDIGVSAIKAVRFRRTLSGRETLEYFHQPLPYLSARPLTQAAKAAVLNRFLWQHALYSARDVVTAMPCRDLHIRTLSLPFRDPTKLAQVVPFELENLIPMPIEDLAVGSLVLPPPPSSKPVEGDDHADVLVTAAPRTAVEKHIKFLAEADVEPSAIHIDGLALFSVARSYRQDGAAVPPDLAILDVGASKTTLCLVHEGRPWVLRTIPWGATELTRLLAERFACSLAEAERRKRATSLDLVQAWVDPLLRDIRLSLHAYESSTKTRIKYCWISGGGSKLRAMSEYVAHELGLTAVGPRQGFGSDSPKAFSVAVGLAIHSKLNGSRVRVGRARPQLSVDLKRVADTSSKRETPTALRWRWWAAGLALLVLLGLADLTFRVHLREARVKEINASLAAEYQRHFGGQAPRGEELDFARRQRDSLEKTLAQVDGAAGRALPVLAHVVKHLPSGVPVKMRELTLENGSVHFEAETESFEAVERIKQALLASSSIREVSISETRLGVVARQVVFRAALTVDLP